MRPEPHAPARILTSGWGTLGDFATAAFVVAAATGVVVAVPYDPTNAYGSIAAILLANPAASFFRNAHYWSGQICLVLSLLHVWDHLKAGTEGRVRVGAWLRVVLTLPALAFIMLSGFMLRGDAEGRQALRILTEAIAQVPWAGHLLATLVFGPAERLGVVYVQHAATATIIVWLFVIEHARRLWPRVPAFVVVTVVTIAISVVMTPGLHDGLDPVVKGPWYFLGLQELLHWTPWPRLVLLAGAVIVGALFSVRLAGQAAARAVKGSLLALTLTYLALCAVGGFLRAENWEWHRHWPATLRVAWVFARTPDAPAVLPTPLPVVMDRPEGCLVCHRGVTGLGNAHRPEAVGCASCHGGDVFTLNKRRAHAGMETIAGNLATAGRRCGQSSCHPTITSRVERSVMTTMSGVIAVNREVFGERSADLAHVSRLGRTPADSHLRQLCASCHLGREKVALGPNDEDARGGGCNACHLVYSETASVALARYEADKRQPGRLAAPAIHPAVSLDIANSQCFGCHSRSGRVSTNYEGWNEQPEHSGGMARPDTPLSPARHRRLDDERVFERVAPDIHQERGLDCIDCHTSTEVMGTGVAHSRKSQQLRVACEDCHAPRGVTMPMVPASRLDPESRKILAVRAWPGLAAPRYGRTQTGEVLVNVVGETTGGPSLMRKRTGEHRQLKPAAAVCTEGAGHNRLSCGSCHTAWAPRCPTCHTSHDPSVEAYDWVDDKLAAGGWKEKGGASMAAQPTLGVRRVAPADGRSGREVVDTFVPGMVLTIEGTTKGGGRHTERFRRLYARVEPHTTRREARPCTSCHNDPLALGYGQGRLRFEVTPTGGHWRFTPSMPPLPQDGLPADAWVPFLGDRSGPVSTRDDVRPFTVREQRRILRVGACLTCHKANSPVMRDSVRDFDAVVDRRSRRCVLPVW
jgi:hypothetical protein